MQDAGSALARRGEDVRRGCGATVHSRYRNAMGAAEVRGKSGTEAALWCIVFGALVYSFQFNQKNYNLFKTELIHRQAGSAEINTDLKNLSDANLNELQDYYHRNRDLTIVGMALLYALNVLDATVDAHLFDFNVNEDLSLNIRPKTLYSSSTSMPIAGLGLTLNFK